MPRPVQEKRNEKKRHTRNNSVSYLSPNWGLFVAFCLSCPARCRNFSCKADRALLDGRQSGGRTAPNAVIDACLGIVAHACCRFHAVQRATPAQHLSCCRLVPVFLTPTRIIRCECALHFYFWLFLDFVRDGVGHTRASLFLGYEYGVFAC